MTDLHWCSATTSGRSLGQPRKFDLRKNWPEDCFRFSLQHCFRCRWWMLLEPSPVDQLGVSQHFWTRFHSLSFLSHTFPTFPATNCIKLCWDNDIGVYNQPPPKKKRPLVQLQISPGRWEASRKAAFGKRCLGWVSPWNRHGRHGVSLGIASVRSLLARLASLSLA